VGRRATRSRFIYKSASSSSLLHSPASSLPPPSSPSLRLSTCSRSLPTFLSFSFFSFPRSASDADAVARSSQLQQGEFLLAAKKRLSLSCLDRALGRSARTRMRAYARLLLSKYEFKIVGYFGRFSRVTQLQPKRGSRGDDGAVSRCSQQPVGMRECVNSLTGYK